MAKRKIGKTWKRRMRKISGKKRLCKVRKIGGREQVRRVGRVNVTDKKEWWKLWFAQAWYWEDLAIISENN